jgi:hypothetical protein
MSATDFASLQPHLQPVPMPLLKDMERPNRRIETVYFMENGIASVVAVQPDETRVEVGLIGREGMSGIAVVLGGDQSPHATYIQVAGEGQRCRCRIHLIRIRWGVGESVILMYLPCCELLVSHWTRGSFFSQQLERHPRAAQQGKAAQREIAPLCRMAEDPVTRSRKIG